MRKGLYALSVTFVLITGVAVYLGVTYFFPAKEPRPDAAPAYARLAKAKASKLEAAYTKWVARHERNGGDHNVVFGLGWSKAYSKEFTRAAGRADLDLIDGTVTVQVQGFEGTSILDVWLVDNQPGRSAAPDPGDKMLWVGALRRSGEKATLHAELSNLFEDFEVDLVAVTRSGKDPSEAGILFGSQRLFQRLYTRARTGRLTAPGDSSTSRLAALGPSPAYADVVFPTFDALIQEGADLFFNETFDGNGRTCGTCHPAENNFTIDPVFIAGLPDDDPLFVAEFVPALAVNFEKPELMRKVGLILENTNGFNPPATNFTMRGVPHTQALSTSLTPSLFDGTTVPPIERTGWSGDGAPGDGSLRQFANGAVTQHFPKTLGRMPNVDFRLPDDDELDAMEAFQLFLGRQAEIVLASLTFNSPVVERGKVIFNTSDTVNGTVAAGKCVNCHNNAGANAGDLNFNFNTGVEDLPDQPADLIDTANNPGDDGFGNLGTFNTPTLIEAADTGPFFHNNSIETIEEAVNFYNSDAFNDSPAGQFLASTDSSTVIGIDLETTQVVAVAALLRVLNALENIRNANESLGFIVNEPKSKGPLIDLATAEIKDAIQVLYAAGLHPIVKQKLTQALDELMHGKGKALVSNAMGFLQQARDDLACTAPVANNVFGLAACP